MDAACLIFAYHTALMVTFSPGVKSWGTNSQWQLLLSSTMSSPGRLASKKHNTDSRTLELVHKPPKPPKTSSLTSSVPHQTGQCNAVFIKLRDGHHGESEGQSHTVTTKHIWTQFNWIYITESDNTISNQVLCKLNMLNKLV